MPVLVMVALLAELSEKGVEFSGRYRTAAELVAIPVPQMFGVKSLSLPLLSSPNC